MERVGNYTTVEDIERMDREGRIERNLRTAPLKDTVTVPDGGFTILRFLADNPGMSSSSSFSPSYSQIHGIGHSHLIPSY